MKAPSGREMGRVLGRLHLGPVHLALTVMTLATAVAPPEALLRLGSEWSQADGFWIAPVRGKGAAP